MSVFRSLLKWHQKMLGLHAAGRNNPKRRIENLFCFMENLHKHSQFFLITWPFSPSSLVSPGGETVLAVDGLSSQIGPILCCRWINGNSVLLFLLLWSCLAWSNPLCKQTILSSWISKAESEPWVCSDITMIPNSHEVIFLSEILQFLCLDHTLIILKLDRTPLRDTTVVE